MNINKAVEHLQLKLLLIDKHNDKAKDIVKLQHFAILQPFKWALRVAYLTQPL